MSKSSSSDWQLWERPIAWLLRSAAGRLHATQPDWADAMIAEAAVCTSATERLRWAWGCWIASLRISSSLVVALYTALLGLGLALMTAYEWRADESLRTVATVAMIASLLGAIRPSQALLSGTLVGLVVTGVLGFEVMSGIHPAYETRAQTLGHSLHWSILLLPGIAAALTGAEIGRRLRPWQLP